MKRRAALLLVVLACCQSLRAQTGETRTLPLTVLNSKGGFELGLTAQNVRLKGHIAAVRGLTQDTGPRRIIVLLDASGSMGEMMDGKRIRTWDYTKEMVKQFLRNAFRGDSIALYVFGDKVNLAVPFTRDLASIPDGLDKLPQPRGMTNAGDALRVALSDFGDVPEFGDAIVFFSDGQFQDDRGRKSLLSLLASGDPRSVRVFLIVPSEAPLVWSTPEEMPNIGSVMNFVSATGGFSFAPEGVPADWPTTTMIQANVFERIAALSNAIHETYRMDLQFAEPIRKKKSLQLEIVDANSKTTRDLYVLYPHTLYPATKSGESPID